MQLNLSRLSSQHHGLLISASDKLLSLSFELSEEAFRIWYSQYACKPVSEAGAFTAFNVGYPDLHGVKEEAL